MSNETGSGDAAAIVRDITASIEAVDRMTNDEIVSAAKSRGTNDLMWIATETANDDCDIALGASGSVVWTGTKLMAIGEWASLKGYSDAAGRFQSKYLSVLESLREFQRWAREESDFEFDFAAALHGMRSDLEDVLVDLVRFVKLFAEMLEARSGKTNDEAWTNAVACLCDEEIALVEAIKASPSGLSYSEMIHVKEAFDNLAIESNARTRIKRIRDVWKEKAVPFEIPKPRRKGKLQVVQIILDKNATGT